VFLLCVLFSKDAEWYGTATISPVVPDPAQCPALPSDATRVDAHHTTISMRRCMLPANVMITRVVCPSRNKYLLARMNFLGIIITLATPLRINWPSGGVTIWFNGFLWLWIFHSGHAHRRGCSVRLEVASSLWYHWIYGIVIARKIEFDRTLVWSLLSKSWKTRFFLFF